MVEDSLQFYYHDIIHIIDLFNIIVNIYSMVLSYLSLLLRTQFIST